MTERGHGCIVNISSTSAIAAFPLHAYAPAKAAISHLTAILASDLGPRGVRVNAVVPGYVLTEQMQARIDAGYRDKDAMQRQSALGRIVLPDEVADGIHSCAPMRHAPSPASPCRSTEAGCRTSPTSSTRVAASDWDPGAD